MVTISRKCYRENQQMGEQLKLRDIGTASSSEDEGDYGVCLDTVPLMCGDSFEMDESDRLVNERRRRSRGFFNNLSHQWSNLCSNCWGKLFSICCREKELQPRIVHIGLGTHSTEKHPRNVIRNQKYSIITFIPLVLFEQFKFFLNLYFLVMALSQLLPELRIGYLYTYWGPLG
ncbi:ATP synthase subunit 9 [Bulinus truncatus]|nr:ATP synthase subunit 9 [Bulinus truncatus]